MVLKLLNKVNICLENNTIKLMGSLTQAYCYTDWKVRMDQNKIIKAWGHFQYPVDQIKHFMFLTCYNTIYTINLSLEIKILWGQLPLLCST